MRVILDVASIVFCIFFFFLMIRRPPRSTQSRSSAASDVYKRQEYAIELIQKQLIEAKRERIVRRSKEVETNLRKGKVKRGTMEDLLKDLEND